MHARLHDPSGTKLGKISIRAPTRMVVRPQQAPLGNSLCAPDSQDCRAVLPAQVRCSMPLAALTAKLARAFNRSEQGSVAVIFSLTASVLMLTVFGVIDYGRSVNAKAELQAALDAAALRAARTTEFTDPDAKLQKSDRPHSLLT